MAASVTQIANLALARLGQVRIENISDDDGNESRWCQELYPFARDYVTEDGMWRHAKRTLVLEEVDNDLEDDWDVAYARPSDCFSFRLILPNQGAFDPRYPLRFITEGDVIYTDEAQARGLYIRQVTDVTKFTPSFTDAVAWYLAHLLAMPLKQSAEQMASMLNGYAQAKAVAISKGNLEELYIRTADEAMPDWMTGR